MGAHEKATRDDKSCTGVIRPIILDVTKDEHVTEAVKLVKASGVPLHAVVNNAGISAFGFAEMLPLWRYESNINVNLLGTVRCCQQFLPLIRASGGRICNMGSIGATSPSAFGSSYLAT